MDKLGEVDPAQKSSFTKELDKLGQVDINQQVMDVELKEGKDVKGEMRKMIVRMKYQTGKHGKADGRSSGKEPLHINQRYIQIITRPP